MYERIIAAASSAIWLCTREKLDEIWLFLDRAEAGIRADAQTIELLAANNRDRRNVATRSMTGVIPVIGTISQRAGLLEDASGGVSTEAIGQAFDAMQASEDVSRIILEIDSSGGTYPGIPELAQRIYDARGNTPTIAHVNAQAGSGALWLASAANEVVITPSGAAGSVGAYTTHVDESKLNEDVGVQREYISYGKYKVEGNSDGPLESGTRDYLQDRVNEIGLEFETALAKYRGTTVKRVQSTFGQGRMLTAKQAAEVGMVDRIATFESTIRATQKRGKTRVEIAKRRMMI